MKDTMKVFALLTEGDIFMVFFIAKKRNVTFREKSTVTHDSKIV